MKGDYGAIIAIGIAGAFALVFLAIPSCKERAKADAAQRVWYEDLKSAMKHCDGASECAEHEAGQEWASKHEASQISDCGTPEESAPHYRGCVYAVILSREDDARDAQVDLNDGPPGR